MTTIDWNLSVLVVCIAAGSAVLSLSPSRLCCVILENKTIQYIYTETLRYFFSTTPSAIELLITHHDQLKIKTSTVLIPVIGD
jgi:hypothetical protein